MRNKMSNQALSTQHERQSNLEAGELRCIVRFKALFRGPSLGISDHGLFEQPGKVSRYQVCVQVVRSALEVVMMVMTTMVMVMVMVI